MITREHAKTLKCIKIKMHLEIIQYTSVRLIHESKNFITVYKFLDLFKQ